MNLPSPERKRILAVCYGGGHVLMLIPVLKQLEAQGFDVEIAGLTTAAAALRKAGFEPLGFRDLIREEDTRAREHGELLAAEMHQGSKVNSLEESIAYLGLSYADLEDQLGVEGAAEAFAERGRQAFLPLGPVRRLFDLVQPDVLLTTNSPRAELASIRVAAERGIPSVGVLDLFGLQPYNDIPADRVCVPFHQATSILVDRGLKRESLTVTGNPNFDWIHKLTGGADQTADWRSRHGVQSDELLVLYGMKPNWDQHEEMIVQCLEQLIPERPHWKVAVRPHPNSDAALAQNVIQRLGPEIAFLNENTPLSDALTACDALITHKSTVSVEAALLGKQVALVHSNHDYPTHGIPLHLFGWGTFSITVAEGIEALSHWKKDSPAQEAARGAEVRTAWNCDGQSHMRIAAVVAQALEQSQQRHAA
ncbi:Capsule polysaccharide biosynthesis protein [Gimesia panareensis]|uniref:Capsule polysaccharide biosynthesis protein n=1 Tax=Gimesia panareensis TaxID=2527978 RepID=A0A517Q850_9PLAN|nr:hypothetical protein [Gimesia panareensis]QDT27804.1 Capsule polysaccharide biosynthesis protein [Gimesia panareensis]